MTDDETNGISIQKASNMFFPKLKFDEKFNLKFDQEKQQTGVFVLSDYTHRMYDHCNMKFSKKFMLFYEDMQKWNERFIEEQENSENGNEWFDVQTIELCPFEGLNEIQYEKFVFDGSDGYGGSIPKEEIMGWIESFEDIQFTLPQVFYMQGMIAIFFPGNPISHRIKSHAKRNKINSIVSQLKNTDFQSIIPKPSTNKISVFFDVFNTNYDKYLVGNHQVIPDIDRFFHFLLDALQGIVYENDRQISFLNPRIWDTSDILHTIRLQTHPDYLRGISDSPIGLLYPLSMGIMDYYVMRISCNHYLEELIASCTLSFSNF